MIVTSCSFQPQKWQLIDVNYVELQSIASGVIEFTVQHADRPLPQSAVKIVSCNGSVYFFICLLIQFDFPAVLSGQFSDHSRNT